MRKIRIIIVVDGVEAPTAFVTKTSASSIVTYASWRTFEVSYLYSLCAIILCDTAIIPDKCRCIYVVAHLSMYCELSTWDKHHCKILTIAVFTVVIYHRHEQFYFLYKHVF